MRKFIEEYGFVLLMVLAVVAMLVMVSPLGFQVKDGIIGMVDRMKNIISLDDTIKPENAEIFAVYSEDDRSLCFYEDDIAQAKEGEQYRGKTVSNLYDWESISAIGVNIDTGEETLPPWIDKDSVNPLIDPISIQIVDNIIMPEGSKLDFWFALLVNISDINVGNLDTSNVISMMGTFVGTGANSDTFTIQGLEKWNTSSVTNMYSMFKQIGYKSEVPFELNLSSWDISNVVDMGYMFYNANVSRILIPKNIQATVATEDITSKRFRNNTDGFIYPEGSFPVGNGNVSHTLELYMTYELVNGRAFNDILRDIDDTYDIKSIKFIDTPMPDSNVNEIYDLDFDKDNGVKGWYIIDSDNKAKVYISSQKAGQKVIANNDSSFMFASIESNTSLAELRIDVELLEVSKVDNMRLMFAGVGKSTKKIIIDGLETWDTSNVTDMSGMFQYLGEYSENVKLSDLSQWNTSKVQRTGTRNGSGTEGLFMSAGLKEIDISGWNLGKSIDNSAMFGYIANSHPNTELQKITLPKKINYNAEFLNFSWGTWYDADNNYQEVKKFPDDLIEGHTLVRTIPSN